MLMPRKCPLLSMKTLLSALAAATGILLICALGGCAGTKDLLVRTAPVKIDYPTCRPALPAPDPIKTFPVSWMVISYGNPAQPLFALTTQDYENLSRSMADTRRWVDEASGQLRHYRKNN